MKHATTRMLFAYWDSLRGERAAPERGEIEPGEIRHILADTFILETVADRPPEIRLAGTRLCALFGRELKGVPFAELWRNNGSRETARFVELVTSETAGLVIGLVATSTEGANLDLELLLLPLRHRGKTHVRLLGALSAKIVPPWIGLHPIAGVATVSLRVISPSQKALEPSFGPGSAEAAEKRRQFIVHRGGLG